MTTKKKDPTGTTGTRTVSQLIEELDMGALNAEASKELRGLLQSLSDKIARDGVASGTLTVKLSFTAAMDKKLHITGDVTSKRPARKRVTAAAWIDGDSIASKDPDQLTIEEHLNSVPANDSRPLNGT